MILGMTRRKVKISTAIACLVLPCAAGIEPTPLLARAINAFSLAHQSTPELQVRVYSFPGLSPWMLAAAEVEARRLLLPASVEFQWVDCASRLVISVCGSPQGPADLIVRVLAKALPNVSTAALGITDSSDRCAAAFIFYDRIVALRTHSRLLPVMLGRVIAHEIIHLLLPGESHAEMGLMRGHWDDGDLRIANSTFLGLPGKLVQLMRMEAVRRGLAAAAPLQDQNKVNSTLD